MSSGTIDLGASFGSGGGGGGAVTSVNGQTGAVSITKSSIGLGNLDTTSGPSNAFMYKDSLGNVLTSGELSINSLLGINFSNTYDVDNTGGQTYNNFYLNLAPSVSSPNDNFLMANMNVNVDSNGSGLNIGTNGNAVTMLNLGIQHAGKSNTGSLNGISQNIQIGNGTDPITVGGMGYSFGFGTIASGVTMSGSVQGYTFQPNFQAGSIMNNDMTAFGDYANSAVPTAGHASARLSPQLNQIKNGSNFTSIDINPTVTAGFVGSASYNGISITPTLGAMGTSGINALYIHPTATNVNYGYGIFSDVSNLTPNPGAVSSLIIQDLTYTFNLPGDNNNYTIEYVNDGTAGAETFNVSGNSVVCHMQSGVSTATQIQAAAIANINLVGAITVTISGTGTNTQVSVGPTNFTGGVAVGFIKAGYFKGDVQIDGSLSFTGGLSLGALNSFANVDISAFPPGVNSIDTLITQPTVAAATTLNTDLLAINTAMLLTVGAGSTLTSSFLGYTALGLPAVVQVGAGSTIDRVGGAAFAISLDGGAGAGGVIDEVDLCRAIAIPNGITTVNKLKGYAMDLPFGDPGTTSWGLYVSPAIHNYMAGDLVVGGVDVPTNSSVGIELNSTTKAILSSRMTTTERDALTAVNGMVLYNTTTDKLQVYAAGSWVDLH